MSALQESLNKLFILLVQQGHVPPSRKVRIVEVHSDVAIDERGRPRLRRADLHTPEKYEARFAELASAGFPWINISCCGLDGDYLVISVETPRGAGHSYGRTSINVSGPTRGVLDHAWDVSEALALA